MDDILLTTRTWVWWWLLKRPDRLLPSHFEGERLGLTFFKKIGKFCKTTLKISENLVEFWKVLQDFLRLCKTGFTDGLPFSSLILSDISLTLSWHFPDTSACLRNTLFICISDMWYKLQTTGWYFDTFFWTLFLLGVAVGANSHVDAFKSCHPTKTDNMPSLPKRGKSQPYPPRIQVEPDNILRSFSLYQDIRAAPTSIPRTRLAEPNNALCNSIRIQRFVWPPFCENSMFTVETCKSECLSKDSVYWKQKILLKSELPMSL